MVRKSLRAAGAFLYMLMAAQVVLADDTEIYVTRDLPADQRVRPNILFIIDSSGSMDTEVSGSGKKTRNEIVLQVTRDLIDELKVNGDVNIGIMRFSGNHGGRVLQEVKRLTPDNAAAMKKIVNSIPASGNTPLLETFYESFLYLSGKQAYWGNGSTCVERDRRGNCTYAISSVASSLDSGTYISPITHSCQKTNIIYLSDGAPTQDTDSNDAVRSLVSGKNTKYKSASCGEGNGACLPHLAEYMANQDLAPGITGTQTANTYTIGFAVDLPLLKNTAEAGGGKYFTTSNVSGLTEAMKSIIVEILAENTSFAAPSVAVSAYNNLGYRNDLYYALFRPAAGDRWVGNVKRYKLTRDGNGDSLIVDSDGNSAVDPQTGFFRDTARSFWSSTSDGKDVAKGGVAENLPASRTVYTWTGAERTPTAGAGVSGSASLASLADTRQLTNAMLGAANNTERGNFIKWGQGLDPQTNTRRQQVADVLHNEPKLVAYVTDENLERAANARKLPTDSTYNPNLGSSPEQLYMFFSSNEGFIHAVDASNGVEKFAFIPQELLPNLGAYYKDAKGGAKTYGMDGHINLWVEYGELSADSQTRRLSKAFLYAGMRRGGRNYYALDVSNLDDPKLKWVIKGGVTPGFEMLGQTWSNPLLRKIKVNGAPTQVLIFSGGYDTNQDDDDPNTPVSDSLGNALFIVDAETGKLLWSAGNGENADLRIESMTNSIPAAPAVIDVDGDGLVDILFAADTRGQIFRIDLDHSGAQSTAQGGRIASLGGATARDNRRFYYTPDIARHHPRGGRAHFTIAIGSGYRAHPLNNDTEDRFYVLRDYNVYSAPRNYTTLTEADLTDVSSVSVSGEAAEAIRTQLTAKEAEINALNAAVVSAQLALTDYRGDSGLTGKYQQWQQEQNAALERQQQIESIYAGDPFVVEHAPETQKQSDFQKQLVALQALLRDWDDPADQEQVAQGYANLLVLQKALELKYDSVMAAEARLTAALADSEGTGAAALKSELDQLRLDYQNEAAGRDRLSAALAGLIQDAQAADDSGRATALTALESAIRDNLTWETLVPDVSTLLARDEQSASGELERLAANQANDAKLLSEHERERLKHVALADALLRAIEEQQALPYVDSPTLTGEQLAAARDRYGADLTILKAYQFLLDQAIASATAKLPGLRSEINGLYAQLQPGDNYTPNQTLLGQSQGWFMRLPPGEKVLSASLTLNGNVHFTTFSPRGQSVSECGPDVGRGRYYAVNIADASGVFTKDGEIVRGIDLNHSGIPPRPSIIFGDPGATSDSGDDSGDDSKNEDEGEKDCTTILAGTEALGGAGSCGFTRTYWREN